MSLWEAKKNIKKKKQAVKDAKEVLSEIEKLDPELAKKTKKIIDDMAGIRCGGG